MAPVLCAGITVYKGLKESGARPGQTVAIVGAGGGLGSLAQQYAKAMGLRVIAIDTGDEKKKMCLEQLGAEAFVDFATSKNVVKDVQAQTEDGLGPHAVILVAVNERPFQQAAEVWLTVFFPSSFFLFSYPFRAPLFPFRLLFPLFFLRLFGNPSPLSHSRFPSLTPAPHTN